MGKFIFESPELLFCEIPVKDGTLNDHRIWIYHLPSLSLIEFVSVDEFKDFQFKGYQERFEYDYNDELENIFGVFVQNNCEVTGNDSKNVMQKAWKFYEKYLMWEDDNINRST